MSFADLPSDILLLVSDLLVPRDFNEWKQQLSLLSINQNLRRVFFPHLYKHVFMADRLKSEKFLTNVELVATSNFASHLHIHVSLLPTNYTRMKWDLNFVHRPTLFPASYRTLKHMIILLYDYQKACSRITKLSIKMLRPRNYRSQTGDENEYIAINARRCIGALVKLMPDINDLTFCGEELEQCVESMQHELTQNYGAQLSKLHLMQCADFICTSNYITRLKLSHITNLKLKFRTNDRFRPPQLGLQAIQHMDIENLQPEYTWDLFSRDTGSSVEVPYLRKLRLHFINKKYDNEAAALTMLERRLHFPRLRILELRGEEDAQIPLLNMAVLSDKVDKVSIAASASTFMSFSNVALPAARALICKIIGEEPADGIQFFSSFNQLLQNSLNCDSLAVHIDSSIRSDYDRLNCPELTVLKLDAVIDFTTMVAILANHPRLIKTSLAVASGMPSDYNSWKQLTPLNTSVRELYINYSGPLRQRPIVLKYLIAHLPAIRCIYVEGIKKPILQKLASENLSKYPHLVNIKFASNQWLFH